MLSLHPFSESHGRHAAETLQRSVCVLLEGISLNAFRTGPPASPFQNTISGIRSRVASLAWDDEDQAISLTNKAVSCLERYGDETERLASTRTRELRAAMDMFSEALARMAKASGSDADDPLATLAQACKDLVTSVNEDELSQLNRRLRQSLEAICATTEKHEHVRDEIERELTLRRDAPVDGNGDRATGLPEKHDAIQTLSTIIGGTRPGHVLAFAVEHFDTVRTRFGAAVSIGVLQMFAQHLAQRMHASEKLFRWQGACFVVITDEGIPDSMLAAEAARIATSKLEYTSSLGHRDFVLPISAAWLMLPISNGSPLAGVVSTLDEFAGGRHQGSHHSGHAAGRR